MIILIAFILHWYCSLFTQTFYHHRYAAHRMFTMNSFWQKTFHFISYLFQGSSYLTPKAYAVLHRMHHAYSDTDKDPHSPHFHNNAFTMMWSTRKIYNDIVDSKLECEDRFTKDLPEWKALDSFGETYLSRIGWAVIYIGFYIAFADYWWMYLLLPIHFLMSPVHGAIVNWFGHKAGYANFDNNDKSKNSLFFDFLMLGELFQNNHHKHAQNVNFAARWFEIDPAYPFIKLFSWLGIIKLKASK